MHVIKHPMGFFKRIKTDHGQLVAIVTPYLDDAKQFKTRAAAEKFKAKYDGTGCGMDSFKEIAELAQ